MAWPGEGAAGRQGGLERTRTRSLAVRRRRSRLCYWWLTRPSLLPLVTVWSCLARANEMCSQEIVMGCAQPFSLLTDNKEMAMFRSRADLDRICP